MAALHLGIGNKSLPAVGEWLDAARREVAYVAANEPYGSVR